MTRPKKKVKAVRAWKMPDFKSEWWLQFEKMGHDPVLNDYDNTPDQFQVEGGFHNGPRCRKCRWDCCMHCTRSKDIPECTKRTNP